MTDDTIVAAGMVRAQKFGIANEQDLYNLLPEAISEFLAAHTWEFLIRKPRAVTNLSGQDYINPGQDFWKVVAIGWSDAPIMEWITPQEYNARKLGGSTANREAANYTQIERLIYVSPSPTGVKTFTLIDYPHSPNISLQQIPETYHSAVLKLLESLFVPWEHAAFPIVTGLAEKAVNQAIGYDIAQPQRRQRLELSREQKTINVYKRQRNRGRVLPFDLTGGQ